MGALGKSNRGFIGSGGAGGGGTVRNIGALTTDNFTIKGNAVQPTPLYSTQAQTQIQIDLSTGDYTIPKGDCIFFVNPDTNYYNSFILDPAVMKEGGRLTIVNSQYIGDQYAYIPLRTTSGNSTNVYYQGSSINLLDNNHGDFRMPSGSVYEFIYTDGCFRCFNTCALPVINNISIGAGTEYEIVTNAIYKVTSIDTGCSIKLPDPVNFIGLELHIWIANDTVSDVTISGGTVLYFVGGNQTNLGSFNAFKYYKLLGTQSAWILISIQA